MMSIKRINYQLINLFICNVLLVIIFISGQLDGKMYILTITFLVANICCSFLTVDVFFSIPVLLIRVTGLIRFVVIPIIMCQNGRTVSLLAVTILTIEIMASYISILLFNRRYRNQNEANYYCHDNQVGNDLNDFEIKDIFGIASIIILGITTIFIIQNTTIIERLFTFGSTYALSSYESGWIQVCVNIFYLLLYISSLITIYKLRLVRIDAIKVLLMLLMSVFYINGIAVGNSNVSRWAILIGAFLAYAYITSFFPNTKKVLLIVVGVGAIIAIVVGTFVKFNTTWDEMNGVTFFNNYEWLNSYFCGPKNVEISLKLSSLGKNTGIDKLDSLLSDICQGIPLIGSYIGSQKSTTLILFNNLYYGSSIAKDQICPLAGQLYYYFGFLFWIPIMFIVNISLKLYFRSLRENGFLTKYCCIWMYIMMAVGINCLNLTIILQQLWQNVIFVILIDFINKHTRLKETNRNFYVED